MLAMIDCARCGTANPEGSRFCNSCGASLVSRVGVQERRIVTALFADLARSTSLGEKLDPEVVRGLVGEFFELATREIEARGGTVEKFSGDAVMAVFGLPQAHEDDPERAVRAALAIRDGLTAISNDASARQGITVQARIGIESGEVVVGDPFGGATMATGDAMNVAARLEQLAEPTEIVIGETVWEQVRDVVTAEPLGQLALRGRDAGLNGWRVSAIAAEVGRPRGVPRLESPLIGRHEELQMLLDAGRRAQTGNKAALFTIVGVPGVGKSRLVREATFQLTAEGWSTFRGRCLPYGDGITYWPIAEMVRELAAVSPDTSADETRARLAAVSPDADVTDRLAQIIGIADTLDSAVAGGNKEIAWGFRRLVEHVIATRGPIVLVFEDIQWAEPGLLDLIEYLVTWTRDAPLLVVCSSRPELLDNRPSWGSGRMEASRIHLEPLSEEASRSLLGALLTVDDLPAELRQRVLDRAEGNPLFVEEVVRMLIEEGYVERRGDRWLAKKEAAEVRVPDSVEALIRARLDTLPSPERGTLQAASVVGRVFQRSAVAAIGPTHEASPLQQHLEDAILRDLITDERIPDEPTFRFRHILIRDVAYATLPKVRRAELHRAVADWLRAWSGDRIDEFAEIEAYHLEQAVRLRRELEGEFDAVERDRAVAALRSSAERAWARDDLRATRSFTERALALEPSQGDEKLEIQALLADAYWRTAEYRLGGAIAAELEVAAEAAGRKDLVGRALLVKAGDLWLRPESPDSAAAMAEVERARVLLSETNDRRALARAYELMAWSGWWLGDMTIALQNWEQMKTVAHEVGWTAAEAEALLGLGRVDVQLGNEDARARHIDEARALVAKGASRLTMARVARMYGVLLATTGHDDEAQEVLLSAAAELEEFGDREEAYVAYNFLGDIQRRRGDLAEALNLYERARLLVLEHGGYLPEALRKKAQVYLLLGNIDAAEKDAEEAARIVAGDDWATVASTQMVLGQVRAARGRDEEAELHFREALRVMGTVDFSSWEEEITFAEFLLRRGRTDEGNEMVERAVASARRIGPASPLPEFLERRATAAREAGASGAPGDRGGG
jgi:class 3 adenylate cyclase/tetratricopeptide (TPR) repeat protein